MINSKHLISSGDYVARGTLPGTVCGFQLMQTYPCTNFSKCDSHRSSSKQFLHHQFLIPNTDALLHHEQKLKKQHILIVIIYFTRRTAWQKKGPLGQCYSENNRFIVLKPLMHWCIYKKYVQINNLSSQRNDDNNDDSFNNNNKIIIDNNIIILYNDNNDLMIKIMIIMTIITITIIMIRV